MPKALWREGEGMGPWRKGGSLLSTYYELVMVEALLIHSVFKLHRDPERPCFVIPICQNWQLREIK